MSVSYLQIISDVTVFMCFNIVVSNECCCDVADVKVPVQFEFVSQETGCHRWKPWLTVHPSRGFIHISQSFIHFTLFVCDLFSNMCRPKHCLYHVLPPLRMVDNLRVRGYVYNLPECSTSAHKKSFVVRSLYNFI